MNVEQAIKNRFSCRAFLDRSVDPDLIRSILNTARWSPSGVNMQPWQVAVVQGSRLKSLSQALLHARQTGQPPRPDYDYYPQEWRSPYKERRFACAKALYQSLGIWGDRQQCAEAALNNERFFNAPVSLFFFIEDHQAQGAWLDIGIFMQSIMLLVTEQGLATCSQASTADYPDIVRQIIGMDEHWRLLAGMAIGYPDLNHPVNQYRTERAKIDTWVHWFN